MTLSITFYDNIKYHRMDFINRDLDFFGNGVVALTDFPVTFPATPNMTAYLGQGRAWVDGYRISNDSSPVTLTFSAADTTNPRIDIVQLGHDDINMTYSLQVKKGVAAASPVEPGADPGYIKLWAVSIAANQTSVSSGNFTDRRTLVPLNVSGTQINMAGAAGTGQANTFTGGFAQTFTGQIISQVTQGTSPFTVVSTTSVTNLNADMVDGYHLNQGVQTTDSPTFASITSKGNITIFNGGNNGVSTGTAPYLLMQNYNSQAGGQATFLSNWGGVHYWGIGGIDSSNVKIGVAGSGGVWVNDGTPFTLQVGGGLTVAGGLTVTGATNSSSTAPTSPVAGQQWYNSTTNRWEYWNGTAWVDPLKYQ